MQNEMLSEILGELKTINSRIDVLEHVQAENNRRFERLELEIAAIKQYFEALRNATLRSKEILSKSKITI